jgi:hypothetical protein
VSWLFLWPIILKTVTEGEIKCFVCIMYTSELILGKKRIFYEKNCFANNFIIFFCDIICNVTTYLSQIYDNIFSCVHITVVGYHWGPVPHFGTRNMPSPAFISLWLGTIVAQYPTLVPEICLLLRSYHCSWAPLLRPSTQLQPKFLFTFPETQILPVIILTQVLAPQDFSPDILIQSQ